MAGKVQRGREVSIGANYLEKIVAGKENNGLDAIERDLDSIWDENGV